MRLSRLSLASLVYAGAAAASSPDAAMLDACPGYKAISVSTKGNTLTANLALAGTACNVYGTDVEKLKVEVTYESSV